MTLLSTKLDLCIFGTPPPSSLTEESRLLHIRSSLVELFNKTTQLTLIKHQFYWLRSILPKVHCTNAT